MPYIKKEDRVWFPSVVLHNTGELNYAFTQLILNYLDYKGERYQTYNDIIGALECCKQEVYRRKVSLYEETKIKENEDVY